jgi:hypothetical protein
MPNRTRRRDPDKRIDVTVHHPRLKIRWASAITEQAWELYERAMIALSAAGVEHLLGGGFALATFTGRWRDTKDIDFYIRPGDRQRAQECLLAAGFEDLFPRAAYDRKWIYRSTHQDIIVDCIWAMANQRAQVDDAWFEGASTIRLRGHPLKVVPMEEFMWCKLYIMQRDHCDWTDLFNLLYTNGTRVDWDHVLWRAGPDAALVKGLLVVFGWLCPKRAALLPPALWDRLGLPVPEPVGEEVAAQRIRMLDSRCWFAALQPRGEKLEV